MAHTAVKIILDEEDNRRAPPYDTKVAKAAMLEHFEISDRFYYHILIILPEHFLMYQNHNRFGLLEHCYSKFSKAVYAGYCAKLANGAHQGDPLCRHIFKEAGRVLGECIGALLPSISKVSFKSL